MDADGNFGPMYLTVLGLFGPTTLSKVEDHEFTLTLHIHLGLTWQEPRVKLNNNLTLQESVIGIVDTPSLFVDEESQSV